MTMHTAQSTQLEAIVFSYLNELRESGETNMFGAGPYVQAEFGVDKKEARRLVLAWMAQF